METQALTDRPKRIFAPLDLSTGDIRAIFAHFRRTNLPVAMRTRTTVVANVDELIQVIEDEIMIDFLRISVADARGRTLQFEFETRWVEVRNDGGAVFDTAYHAICEALERRGPNGLGCCMLTIGPA